ncbi:PGF-CTERM sorting domain-containing protein [Haloparvum sedimenti]|uniref:PGF-CTERM sorting domain-containing protein n=1 Tax=Haloparvum sedimenti TaxID=1678448 RepID=UPI00071E8115|nr:PGF-CTERM sorting domain-containing protein [Haloparvum sedimenti]
MTRVDAGGDDGAVGRARGCPGVRALTAAALACLLFAGVGLGAAVGPAAAGDNVAVFSVEPETAAAEPGDTFSVRVGLESHGAYGDAEVAAVDLWLDYPASHLAVERVEPGDWFAEASADAADSPDYAETVRNAESGVVSVDQSLRNPREQATTGVAHFATVTFRVRDEADPATARIDASRSEVRLTSQYPQPVADAYADVNVSGGGPDADPAYVEEPAFESFGGEEEESRTTSATTMTGGGDSTGAAESGSESGVSAPGFGPVVALLALLAAALLDRR